MQQRLSLGYLLQEQDIKRYQQYEDRGVKLEAKFYHRLQEAQGKCYGRYEGKNKEILEKSSEIS